MSVKAQIKHALIQSANDPNFDAIAKRIFNALGYKSERVPSQTSQSAADFIDQYPTNNKNATKSEREFKNAVNKIAILFQITKDEINKNYAAAAFDAAFIQSFLFIAVELKQAKHNRSQYAAFTREINKRFAMPALILFSAAPAATAADRRVTIAFVNRRQSKTDAARDVLQKVSLIKDISLAKPQRGHIDILAQLEFNARLRYIKTEKGEHNFDGLLKALLHELDAEALNKRFYRELFEWFEWALKNARFPNQEDQKRDIKPEEHLIRLITRLLACYSSGS